jgi:hypothetical protein
MLAGTRKLSDAECGRLFRALLRYSAGEDVGLINLQGREEVLFDVYSQQIDRDVKAYEASVSRSRENGSKGGRPKKSSENPVVFLENPENPVVFKKTQKTQDKDKDKDKDEDKDEDKGKDKDEYLKKEIDNHWKTSARARAATAQHLVDTIIAQNHGASRLADLHDILFKTMSMGISPNEILAESEHMNAMQFSVWLAEKGVLDDDT